MEVLGGLGCFNGSLKMLWMQKVLTVLSSDLTVTRIVIVYTNIDLYSSYKFYMNIVCYTSFIISFC